MIKSKPLVGVPAKYGLIASGFYILLFFILAYFKDNPYDTIKWVDFLLIPIFVYFSIREFKVIHNHRELRYWQGMTLGFICYMVIAVTAALFVYAYFGLIDPENFLAYKQEKVDLVMSQKDKLMAEMSEETYRRTLENTRTITKISLSLDTFLRKVFTGLFLTIVISVTQRTKSR
ncbi:DUF4199 domain-containing protein [Roseivirga sp. BDSF3-8]|uniref:DUF4199 domain-containing protein n=1 Tax=Roseivirga sp. BDSF3-8 TaxID=3241598 RepID=UPI003531C868